MAKKKKVNVRPVAATHSGVKSVAVKKPVNGNLDTNQLALDMIKKRDVQEHSLMDVSKLTGIDKSVLHRMETGIVTNINHLIPICNWLGRQVQYYLTKK